MDLIKEIEAFIPFNEQEEADKAVFLDALHSAEEAGKNIFTRDEQAHITCSIWVLNPDHSKTIMVYHNIYDSWSWIGGHADDCRNLASVALRELEEETGVVCSAIQERPNPESSSNLLSLEVLTVDGHVKRGKYVSSHLHLNVTYLAIADEDQALRIKEDENAGVQWIDLDKVVEASSEPWIASRIYQKLIDKCQAYGC